MLWSETWNLARGNFCSKNVFLAFRVKIHINLAKLSKKKKPFKNCSLHITVDMLKLCCLIPRSLSRTFPAAGQAGAKH